MKINQNVYSPIKNHTHTHAHTHTHTHTHTHKTFEHLDPFAIFAYNHSPFDPKCGTFLKIEN